MRTIDEIIKRMEGDDATVGISEATATELLADAIQVRAEFAALEADLESVLKQREAEGATAMSLAESAKFVKGAMAERVRFLRMSAAAQGDDDEKKEATATTVEWCLNLFTL